MTGEGQFHGQGDLLQKACLHAYYCGDYKGKSLDSYGVWVGIPPPPEFLAVFHNFFLSLASWSHSQQIAAVDWFACIIWTCLLLLEFAHFNFINLSLDYLLALIFTKSKQDLRKELRGFFNKKICELQGLASVNILLVAILELIIFLWLCYEQ